MVRSVRSTAKTSTEKGKMKQKNRNIKEPEISSSDHQDDQKNNDKHSVNNLEALKVGNENESEQKSEEYSSNVDYCLSYLQSLNWNRPLKRTTDMCPWIEKDEWKNSFAEKYMNYEMEQNYVDLDNPLYDGPLIEDLRKKESRKKSKKKSEVGAEFSVIKEGVKEVDKTNHSQTSDSDENFLDEFGNLKENISEASEEESASDNSEVISTTGLKRKRKKHKKQKGKGKGKISKDTEPHGLKTDIREEVLKQSNKYFIDYDKTPIDKQSAVNNRLEQKDELNAAPHSISKFHYEEPKTSILNQKEQNVYLNLKTKFQGYSQLDISLLPLIDQKDYKLFIQYRDLLQEEQEEYQNWCKDIFIQQGDSDIKFIPADVRRYIDEYYEERLRRVPMEIPRHYVPINQLDKISNSGRELLRLVPLVKEQSNSKARFEMRFEKPICQLGLVQKIIIPNENTLLQHPDKMVLPTDYQKLCERYPPSNTVADISKAKESKFQQLHKTSVANDPNAEKLARFYKPDIVISTSAIKTIFNNFGPNYEREWEIPITLWLIEDGQCIIFINKPLPKKNMNVLDKKKWYAKIAAKSFLLHPRGKTKHAKNRGDIRTSQSGDERNFKSYDDLTLFQMEVPQLDGIIDGQSSSEDEKMVIDEGLQGEVGPVATTTQRVAKNIPDEDEDTLDETTVTVNFGGNRKPSLKLMREFNIDENFCIQNKEASHDEKVPEKSSKSTFITQSLNDKDSTATKTENAPNVTFSNLLPKRECSTHIQDLPNKEIPKTESNSRGSRNKLDEVLHRTQRENFNRSGKRRGTRGRGRGRRENVSNQLDNQSNVLTDIMAAQDKTSHKAKDEPIRKNPELTRKQIHEFNGLTNPFVEIGDVNKDYIHPNENNNLNYSLWKLGRKEEPNPVRKKEKNLPEDSLRILVRSNTHGVRLESDPSNENEFYPQFYTIDSKVENQAKFGAETVTKSELAKQWIATMLRPNSKLSRLRVNVSKADVLMAENKTLKDLTNDGQKVGFKPDEALGNLFTLFSELKTLPKPIEKENGIARYLVQHNSKTGVFVKILKSINQNEISQYPSSTTIDIHEAYNIRSDEEATLPPIINMWLPIDADLVTPYHNINNKVPCLFSPNPLKNKNFRGRGRGKRIRRSL